jgi:hypothetical protein
MADGSVWAVLSREISRTRRLIGLRSFFNYSIAVRVIVVMGV